MFHVDFEEASNQDFKVENDYANDSIDHIDDSLIKGVDKNQISSLFDPNFSIQQDFCREQASILDKEALQISDFN